MNKACVVHGGHSRAELDAGVHRLARIAPAVLLQPLLERAAANELHPQAHAVADLLRVKDRDDARMADLGEQPALADNRSHLRICGVLRRHQLDRDFTIEACVPRPVHLAEGAAANPFEQLEVAPGFRKRVVLTRGGQAGFGMLLVGIGAVEVCDR